MKTILLDTNELRQDWMLAGLKYQLLEHVQHATWFDVCVPSVVLEELIATHERAVAVLEEEEQKLDTKRRIMGLPPTTRSPAGTNYRTYLIDRFDEILSFTVLPWPDPPHRQLAMRAIRRMPPFNAKGTGYRDALIWADAVDLARRGKDVALVSMDRAFSGDDGRLAPALQADVGPLEGKVELVRDFSRWLIDALPWKSVPDLAAAVSISRASEFYDWYLKSDFQDDLEPPVETLGFRSSPYRFEILNVDWDGNLVPVNGGIAQDDGLTLVEYEIGYQVEFEGEFSEGVTLEPGWIVSQRGFYRGLLVEGAVAMILNVAVLYGGEFGFSVEELSWCRRDGTGVGVGVHPRGGDPQAEDLFGTHSS